MTSSHTDLIHPIKIANKDFAHNLFLAPLAGHSNAAFRSICNSRGAALCYTEMISAEGLIQGGAELELLIAREKNEKEYAIQLFGADPQALAKATELALEYRPILIDLNAGCPVPKINKSGGGSALMKDRVLFTHILRAMKGALAGTDIPLTVKMRLGWDSVHLDYLEFAAAAVDAGVDAITLHARSRDQGYSGRASYTAIAELKAKLHIPLIGSGDLFSAQDAARMLSETKCDALMFARGAIGNPFIFRQTLDLLHSGNNLHISTAERVNTAREHLTLCVKYFGEVRACREFRKEFCAYAQGQEELKELRLRGVQCSTVAEYEVLFNEWINLGQ